MDNKNFQVDYRSENNESKAKKFWKFLGIGALSLFAALLTVVVINL